MNLTEAVAMVARAQQDASQPSDLQIGTVTGTDPLEITVAAGMAPLRAPVLLLTEAVVEKKIPLLRHRHIVPEHAHVCAMGSTQSALTPAPLYTEWSLLSENSSPDVQQEDILTWEDGAPYPRIDAGVAVAIRDGCITLVPPLRKGEKVLLLRVQHGQRFIVLSRLYEAGGGA